MKLGKREYNRAFCYYFQKEDQNHDQTNNFKKIMINGNCVKYSMLIAAKTGNLSSLIKNFSQDKSCINATHLNFHTAREGHFNVVKFLIDNGEHIPLDHVNDQGDNVFHIVSRSGHVKIMELLLSSLLSSEIPSLCKYNQQGYAPIHLAVLHHHPLIVHLLLSKYNNVNTPDLYHNSLLYLSIKEMMDEIVIILLNFHCSLEYQSPQYDNILMLSVCYLHFKGFSYLLKYLPAEYLNTQRSTDGFEYIERREILRGEVRTLSYIHLSRYMLIHLAVIYNDWIVVKYLLDIGASVNSITFEGYTPLILAARFDKYDTLFGLIQYNSPINHKDVFGGTALYYSIHQHNIPISRLLLLSRAHVSLSPPHNLDLYLNHDIPSHNQIEIIKIIDQIISLEREAEAMCFLLDDFLIPDLNKIINLFVFQTRGDRLKYFQKILDVFTHYPLLYNHIFQALTDTNLELDREDESVYVYIVDTLSKSTDIDTSGVSIAQISMRFAYLTTSKILTLIDCLVSNGYIHYTIDDQHIALTNTPDLS